MKRSMWVIAVLIGLQSSIALGGPLYGTVRTGNAPAAGVNLAVACPGFGRPAQTPVDTTSDERGSYSLRVPASGRCEMRVRRGNQTGAAFEVFVSNNPSRLDVELNNQLNRVSR